MPSQLDLPLIEELRQGFHNSVKGSKEIEADTHAGSVYDHFGGLASILWSWEAQRDKDQFEALYFDRVTGQELTDYVSAHDGIDRTVDAFGEGTISVSRPDTSAGTGTFWKGTRITLYRFHTSVEYEVMEDTTISSTALSAVVPINATFVGRDSAVNFTPASPIEVRITDPLWDTSWIVTQIVCSEGTNFEPAEEFKSRVKIERKLRRVGYSDIILNKCKEVGAYNVFLLQSDFGGDALDFGINVAYISDSGFTTTDTLRFNTILALESVRVLGADLFVLPMQKTNISFNINLHTWTDPKNLNGYEVKRTAVSYVLDYFRSSSGFSYDLNTIAGQIRKSIPEVVQSVEFVSPTSSASILINGAPPAILTKYELLDSDIVVNLTGPV
jgi:hypothetical protein